jgi:hypothetical protein
MSLLTLLLWLLALAIVIHTLAEAAAPKLTAGRGVMAMFDRAIWLDNLPIFIALIVGVLLGSRWTILAGVIPAVAVTHPFLDHAILSYTNRHLRSGTGTALFLMLPLGLGFYSLAYNYRWLGSIDIMVGGAIGLGISLLLLWLTLRSVD